MHFARRIAAARDAVTNAGSFEAAGRALLELAARWTPDALARLLGDAAELAAWAGREAVFAESGTPSFAEADFDSPEFREQIDGRQKRPQPTRTWTDAMHGDHDRLFVVAGATDTAMLEDFHEAVIEAGRTRDFEAFAGDFDRIVEKYGWSYNGGSGSGASERSSTPTSAPATWPDGSGRCATPTL